MVARDKLHPRPQLRKEPTLDLTEVKALRRQREADEQALAERRVAHIANERTPPDDGHVWLSVPEAADLLGITRQALNVRARKDQLPSVMKGGRRWIRRDLLEMTERARGFAGRGAAGVDVELVAKDSRRPIYGSVTSSEISLSASS